VLASQQESAANAHLASTQRLAVLEAEVVQLRGALETEQEGLFEASLQGSCNSRRLPRSGLLASLQELATEAAEAHLQDSLFRMQRERDEARLEVEELRLEHTLHAQHGVVDVRAWHLTPRLADASSIEELHRALHRMEHERDVARHEFVELEDATLAAQLMISRQSDQPKTVHLESKHAPNEHSGHQPATVAEAASAEPYRPVSPCLAAADRVAAATMTESDWTCAAQQQQQQEEIDISLHRELQTPAPQYKLQPHVKSAWQHAVPSTNLPPRPTCTTQHIPTAGAVEAPIQELDNVPPQSPVSGQPGLSSPAHPWELGWPKQQPRLLWPKQQERPGSAPTTEELELRRLAAAASAGWAPWLTAGASHESVSQESKPQEQQQQQQQPASSQQQPPEGSCVSDCQLPHGTWCLQAQSAPQRLAGFFSMGLPQPPRKNAHHWTMRIPLKGSPLQQSKSGG